jgi:methionine synthase I (cobalamin-dependent)
MSAAADLPRRGAKRILIKDGAYGTLIQAERLQRAPTIAAGSTS